MKNTLDQALYQALAPRAEESTPENLLYRCRAAYRPKRPAARDLLFWQLKLLGWQVWALEAAAALVLYSLGRELGLWEKMWTLRNAMLCLSTLAMLTALLGLPFLCRAGNYKMLELERATRVGIGGPLVIRFLLLLTGEMLLIGVVAAAVQGMLPLRGWQLLTVLMVPFLLANNEILLLLRKIRPERLAITAVPLFAVQLCLLRLVQFREVPAGLPFAAVVLAICIGGQCAGLAARPEYAAA